MKEAGSVAVPAAVIFGAGYVLNFVWEALHGVYLYQGHDMPVSQYVHMFKEIYILDFAL